LIDIDLIQISKYCLHLKKLFLHARAITDEGLISIIINCLKIEELSINNCKNITDTSLIAISIRFLNLRKISLENCKELTSLGLFLIIENYKKIVEVRVRNCKHLTENVICEIKINFPILKVIFDDYEI
jgi:F-box and leucine-rich repeat protein GRR1